MSMGRYRDKTVAVLAGGLSSEREVSLATARGMADALIERGYTIEFIDAGHDLPQRLIACGADVVLNGLHGTYGEDGRVQGLLDWMNIPYTGPGLRTSQLAMDKAISKTLFRHAGLLVAADVWVSAAQAAEGQHPAIPFDGSVVVKPVSDGSSVGISIVRSRAGLPLALRHAARFGDVLIEAEITGPELSVVCLAGRALGSVEIATTRGFYDYDAKYGGRGETQYHLPPRISDQSITQAQTSAEGAVKALNCMSMCRVDLIMGPAGPVLLELNTLPGMTPTSLVPKVAATLGWDFGEVCERILDLAECGPGRDEGGLSE